MGATAQPDSALADQGRRIYTSLCVRCHGLNLVSNGIGFDLRQFPQDGQERFRTSVTQGLRAMPAWGGVLKPGDIDALWAYVGSVNRWD
jgi:mono/diheme cytochrome c family protein